MAKSISKISKISKIRKMKLSKSPKKKSVKRSRKSPKKKSRPNTYRMMGWANNFQHVPPIPVLDLNGNVIDHASVYHGARLPFARRINGEMHTFHDSRSAMFPALAPSVVPHVISPEIWRLRLENNRYVYEQMTQDQIDAELAALYANL